MIINALKSQPQTGFQGMPAAHIKSKIKDSVPITLYKIDKHDKKFLNLLCEKINFQERMPGFTKQEYERWHEMLELAVQEALKPSNDSYIAASGEKACGIITFSEGRKRYMLNCICTWPIKTGEKVKMAGKSLFYQLFKIFNKNNGDRIELCAITNGPYDTVSKYKKLGFKEFASGKNKIYMQTNKYNVKSTLGQLGQLMDYEEARNSEPVRLIENISI